MAIIISLPIIILPLNLRRHIRCSTSSLSKTNCVNIEAYNNISSSMIALEFVLFLEPKKQQKKLETLDSWN